MVGPIDPWQFRLFEAWQLEEIDIESIFRPMILIRMRCYAHVLACATIFKDGHARNIGAAYRLSVFQPKNYGHITSPWTFRNKERIRAVRTLGKK